MKRLGLVLHNAESVLVQVCESCAGLLIALVGGECEVPRSLLVVLGGVDPVHVRQSGVELRLGYAVLGGDDGELGSALVVYPLVFVLHVQADHQGHGVGVPEVHGLLEQLVSAVLVGLHVPSEEIGHGECVQAFGIVLGGQLSDLLDRQFRLSVSPVEDESALLHATPWR